MTKKYVYENRIIIQFNNNTRASYSKKLYEGELLEKVANLSFMLDRKVENYFLQEGDIIKIFLREDVFTIINKEDFSLVRDIHWSLNHNGYAHSRMGGKKTYLHRKIAKFQDEDYPQKVVDHINNNPLDNRRTNLRIVSARLNSTNQIGQETKGVQPFKNGFRARWSFQGKDFSKFFSGPDAEQEARLYRLQKMKENNYLRTFNDYPGRE